MKFIVVLLMQHHTHCFGPYRSHHEAEHVVSLIPTNKGITYICKLKSTQDLVTDESILPRE